MFRDASYSDVLTKRHSASDFLFGASKLLGCAWFLPLALVNKVIFAVHYFLPLSHSLSRTGLFVKN